MHILFRLLLVSVATLGASQSRAQQRPVAPDSTTRPAPSPTASVKAGTGPDVIVLLNGDELPAQVVRITPDVVRYLAPLAIGTLAATADTLQLATAQVFMVRYANGTKELLRPAPAAAAGPSLLGLSVAQRHERGRQDSRQYYKPRPGVFWGTFASTATTGYGGLVVGTAIALTDPPRASLNAPAPDLLNDPAYYDGYRRQAKNRKLGKAAAGFGLGAVIAATVTSFLVIRFFGIQ